MNGLEIRKIRAVLVILVIFVLLVEVGGTKSSRKYEVLFMCSVLFWYTINFLWEKNESTFFGKNNGLKL